MARMNRITSFLTMYGPIIITCYICFDLFVLLVKPAMDSKFFPYEKWDLEDCKSS